LCPPLGALPLVWPGLHFCLSLFRSLFIVQWDFCLGILPVNVLSLSQSNLPLLLPQPFPTILYCSSFQCVLLHLVPTQMWCFPLLFTIFLSFFSSSLSLLYKSHFRICDLQIFLCMYNIACICIGSIFHIREKTNNF
jgi:hypothetical protein